jgi:Arc/MetJ-type ribon-helix-helix transcriptional regulator
MSNKSSINVRIDEKTKELLDKKVAYHRYQNISAFLRPKIEFLVELEDWECLSMLERLALVSGTTKGETLFRVLKSALASKGVDTKMYE